MVDKKDGTAMAGKSLMQCPDCGKEVSKRAAACPNCGAPIQELLKGEEYSECNREMNKDTNSCSHPKDKEINIAKIASGDKLNYKDNISVGVGILSIIVIIGMLFLVYQLHVYFD